MAGSSITTTQTWFPGMGAFEVRINWVSDDTAGTVDLTTTESFTGFLVQARSIPGSGGVAPTALYDVVVKDEYGIDVLFGNGADRSGTVAEVIPLTYGAAETGTFYVVNGSTLNLEVSNAGNSKEGSVILTFIVGPKRTN